ncbi:MAG: GDP-mannose 4,6-dehydratase, partial [Cetobacterium sp.]
MKKVSNVDQNIVVKYGIEINDLNIYIHSGTFKHIERRHPDIQNPLEVITRVLKKPDYIGQHPTEENSLEFVKKINENYLVAIKIDTKTSKFIVATTYSISEAKLQKHLLSKRLISTKDFTKKYLVTGGAGFIGANFVKYMLEKHSEIEIIVLDKLTYAGNLGTIREELKDSRVSFFKGDICNKELVENIFMAHDIDYVVNFAAESHVDRSIENPGIFLETNILGTQNLMEVAKAFWSVSKDENGYPVYKAGKKFHHVSTDEVYGSLAKDWEVAKELILDSSVREIASGRANLQSYGNEMFLETTPLDPRSPYSA